jgi:putative Mg2+ transporter-C (MgtC) family protein
MQMPGLEWNWEDLGRLVLAVVFGIFIGFERETHHKPAGVRTIGIVTLGSALVMLLGIRLSQVYGDAVDPSRMAGQVLTGIGFLCAGVIIQARMHVQGLTTAAVVWLMSAVGIAVGAGWYVPATAAVLLAWLGLQLDPFVDRIMSSLKAGSSPQPQEDPSRTPDAPDL